MGPVLRKAPDNDGASVADGATGGALDCVVSTPARTSGFSELSAQLGLTGAGTAAALGGGAQNEALDTGWGKY